MLRRLEALGDGDVGCAWLRLDAHDGGDPSLTVSGGTMEAQVLLGFVRVGPRTLHPLRDAVRAAAAAAAAAAGGRETAEPGGEDCGPSLSPSSSSPSSSGDFIVVFRADPALCAALEVERPEDGMEGSAEAEAALGALEEATRVAALERVILGAERLADVVVVGAGGSALQRLGAEDGDSGATQGALVEELVARRRVCTGNMVSVGSVGQARAVLANLFGDFGDKSALPVLVAAESGQYVGQSFGEREYTLFSSLRGSCSNVDELSAQFVGAGSMVASTTAKACYELLGSASYARGSCVTLLAEWKSQRNAPTTRLLAPPCLIPDRAVLVVRGSANPTEAVESAGGSRAVAVERLSKALKALSSLVDFMMATAKAAANTGTTPPAAAAAAAAAAIDLAEDPAWEAQVAGFLRSAGNRGSRSTAAAKSGEDGAAQLPDAAGQAAAISGASARQGRGDMDFTEYFWQLIVVQARSFPQVLRAVQMLVQALTAGELLPYIHKTNTTLLAGLCRQAISQHVERRRQQRGQQQDDVAAVAAATTAAAASTSAANASATLDKYAAAFASSQVPLHVQRLVVENLVQLGFFKLEKEFDFWLEELGILPSALHELLPPTAATEHRDRLARLERLHETSRLAWTALTFRCPSAQVKSLAVANMRWGLTTPPAPAAATQHACPTFLLPLDNAQLPWVRDEASGVAALPAPKFWQLEQKDSLGAVSQTCRLATDGSQRQCRHSPISPDAARQAAQMLRGDEPEDLVHAFLSRAYEELETDNPEDADAQVTGLATCTANPSAARKSCDVSCVTLQARRVVL